MRSYSDCTVSLSLPLTASVMSDAEANVLDAAILQAQPHGQPIAAQRVVSIGMAVARLDAAEIPRTFVVIEDDVAVELLEVHYANTSWAFTRAATRLATSDSVL